jgi:hypothetical protein
MGLESIDVENQNIQVLQKKPIQRLKELTIDASIWTERSLTYVSVWTERRLTRINTCYRECYCDCTSQDCGVLIVWFLSAGFCMSFFVGVIYLIRNYAPR